MTLYNYAIILMIASSGVLIHGQSTAVIRYPLETLTWNIPAATITETLEQETVANVISGFNSTYSATAATHTINLGRANLTQTVPGATRIYKVPDFTIFQSFQEETLTRTIPATISVETLPSEVATYTVSSGEVLDYYTITGSTVGNSVILTIIESFSTQDMVDIIPGPTVTHTIGNEGMVTIVKDEDISVVNGDLFTYVESLGSTRILRPIEPTCSTRIETVPLPVSTAT
ncbi:hypothetical protein K7432_007930 [Basidiobolus ranarum]|uniref:Uncharacterized protein n=1 Tax=Basidiobolus ranarum TaxID=34480 RepID=A0ABR2VZL6_9FUNG